MSTQTDEGLWGLARDGGRGRPARPSLAEHVGRGPARDALQRPDRPRVARRASTHGCRRFGNRISAGHLDVMYPTWIDDPTPVLDTINSYFGRMDAGWHLLDARDEVMRQRDEVIAAVEGSACPRRTAPVVRATPAGRPAGLRLPGRSRLLHRRGLHRRRPQHAAWPAAGGCERFDLLERADDVFFLTFGELVEILGDLARNEKIGIYHHQALVPSLVAERKEDWAAAAEGRCSADGRERARRR